MNPPQPLLPFVIGVTGKMALPGYEDSVTDPASLSPTARAIYDRVFAILDWVRHDGAAGGSGGCLDPAKGSFDRNGPSVGCWRPLGLERTPIVILSSLAPGADTIVAEAALDYAAARKADVTVRAPLPFPADVHLRSSTFCPEGKEETWDAKKARFQNLVERIRGQPSFVEARDLFCVALDPGLEGDPEADLTAGPPEAPRRRLRYRAAGEYIATASHLLIAVDYRRSITPHPIAIDLFVPGTPAIVESKRRGLSFGLLAISNNFSWVDNGPVLLMPWEDEQTQLESPSGVGPLVWLHPYDTKPKARESVRFVHQLLIALGLRRPADPKPPGERQLEDGDPTWLAQGDHLLRRVLHYQEQFNRLPKASREDGALDGMLKPPKSTRERAVQDITLSPEALALTDALDPLARVRSRASERSQSLDTARKTLLRRLLLLTFAAASSSVPTSTGTRALAALSTLRTLRASS